jgi:membrane-bound serine protease (ClpP class)
MMTGVVAAALVIGLVVVLVMRLPPGFGPGQAVVIEVGKLDRRQVHAIAALIERARDAGARPIMLRINSTGGSGIGALELAGYLRDRGAGREPDVWAWIETDAAGAAVYVALACDRIVMAPDASLMFTRALVVGEGAADREKIDSVLRGDLRASADRNGHPWPIIEALYDQALVYEPLASSVGPAKLIGLDAWRRLDAEARRQYRPVFSGQPGELTADEALRLGIATDHAADLGELAAAFDLPAKSMKVVKP